MSDYHETRSRCSSTPGARLFWLIVVGRLSSQALSQGHLLQQGLGEGLVGWGRCAARWGPASSVEAQGPASAVLKSEARVSSSRGHPQRHFAVPRSGSSLIGFSFSPHPTSGFPHGRAPSNSTHGNRPAAGYQPSGVHMPGLVDTPSPVGFETARLKARALTRYQLLRRFL